MPLRVNNVPDLLRLVCKCSPTCTRAPGDALRQSAPASPGCFPETAPASIWPGVKPLFVRIGDRCSLQCFICSFWLGRCHTCQHDALRPSGTFSPHLNVTQQKRAARGIQLPKAWCGARHDGLRRVSLRTYRHVAHSKPWRQRAHLSGTQKMIVTFRPCIQTDVDMKSTLTGIERIAGVLSAGGSSCDALARNISVLIECTYTLSSERLLQRLRMSVLTKYVNDVLREPIVIRTVARGAADLQP